MKDRDIGISCSIGAVIVKNKETDYETLFQRADGALYEAKKLGKDRTVVCLAFSISGAGKCPGAA